MHKYTSTNPYTEKTQFESDNISNEELEVKINNAQVAFLVQSQSSLVNRKKLILELAEYFTANKSDLALTITNEMGKTLAESMAEVEKCVLCCDYYAEHFEEFLQPKLYHSKFKKAFVSHEPLGVIYGIMPWNFPLWQVIRFAVPTLLAGNSILMKHAKSVPLSALALEDAFKTVSNVPHIYQNLFIDLQQSDSIIAHKSVRGISVTGSTEAGKHIAEEAGKALKPMVLELGGSDPVFILESADIELIITEITKSRNQNAGQSCISGKRFLVPNSMLEYFTAGYLQSISKYTLGNPLLESTTMGPLARKDLKETVIEQVKKAVKQGATFTEANLELPAQGNFCKPGFLTNINNDNFIRYEEVFGPVALIFGYDTVEEGIKLANETDFGLGASIWGNESEAEKLSSYIQSGCVYINTMVKSTPEIPFGGTKSSGIGRELSDLGLYSFTNPKTVAIK